MAEIPKDMQKLLFGMGVKLHAIVSKVLYILGFGCLVMGIISGLMDKELGLLPTYWFMAAITFVLFGLSAGLTAYHAAREGFEK